MTTLRIRLPQILDELGSSHAVIQASAGTGKTYTLEHLVVDLLLQGIPLEAFAIVTYTHKATQELQSRIRATLQRLLSLTDDEVPRAGETSRTLGPSERRALESALRGFDRATLDTIHGFCQRILRDSAFEGGRLFHQEPVCFDDAFDAAYRNLVRTHFARPPLAEFFTAALKDCTNADRLGAFLKQALKVGPYLKAPPDPTVLRQTLQAFPADTAEALLQALEAKDTSRLKALGASAIHSRSRSKYARLLRSVLQARTLALQEDASPNRFWLHVNQEACTYLSQFETSEVVGPTRTLTEHCRSIQNLQYTVLGISTWVLIESLREEIRRWKQERGLYDFDDMIDRVVETLMGPQGEALVQRLRERYQVALIDEFQDTDERQWTIFRRLFLESSDPRHRLILVGDPKQAIYGFRGGDLPTYEAAVREIQERTGRPPLELRTNYRSTGDLLDHLQQIFEGDFFDGGNAAYRPSPMVCGKPSLAFQDDGGHPLPPLQVLDLPDGNAAELRRASAHAIARALKHLLAQRPRLTTGEDDHPIGPGDVFILTSTRAQGQELARILQRYGLPCALYKQEGLFQSAEAQTLLDLLRAIERPWDASRRGRALLGPFFGLSFREAEALREIPEDHPILQRLRTWQALASTQRYAAFFGSLVRDSGVTLRKLFLEEGFRSVTNLLHLLELLQTEALRRSTTLQELICILQAWIEGREVPPQEDADMQRLERTHGAIQILTLHASKGLEAPIVAIHGAWASPASNTHLHRYHQGGRRHVWIGSKNSADEACRSAIERELADEGQRLMYVGLTRAKAHLILPRLSKAPKEGSAYQSLNARLRTLDLTSGRLDFQPQAASTTPPDVPDLAQRMATWIPPEPPPRDLTDFRALALRAAPHRTASYTSLMQRSTALEGVRFDEPEWTVSEQREEPIGGVRLGIAVHTLFEVMPLTSFQASDDFESWVTRPDVAALLTQHLSEGDQPTVARWIYLGLGTPLPLPGGGSVVVAHRGDRLLRELDFLTPYPGTRHLLTGAIDALFEYEGRTYVLDWKTNALGDDYTPERLERVVRTHYDLQVKIYTLTACRFLGIEDARTFEERFGGVLYVFLRGLPQGQGVWTHRPTWAQVQAFQRDLMDLAPTHLAPPTPGIHVHG